MIARSQLDDVAHRLDELFGLVALWLFGSEASGRATEASDVDLAALFRGAVPPAVLDEARAELIALLGRELDLVDLERASPALAMQVLRHGELVSDRDPRRRFRFEAALPSRYEDLRIVRAPIESRLLQRLNG